jgi:hypothetical protein
LTSSDRLCPRTRLDPSQVGRGVPTAPDTRWAILVARRTTTPSAPAEARWGQRALPARGQLGAHGKAVRATGCRRGWDAASSAPSEGFPAVLKTLFALRTRVSARFTRLFALRPTLRGLLARLLSPFALAFCLESSSFCLAIGAWSLARKAFCLAIEARRLASWLFLPCGQGFEACAQSKKPCARSFCLCAQGSESCDRGRISRSQGVWGWRGGRD